MLKIAFDPPLFSSLTRRGIQIYTPAESLFLKRKFNDADIICKDRESAIVIVTSARQAARLRARDEQQRQADHSPNGVQSKILLSEDDSPRSFSKVPSGIRTKPHPVMKQDGNRVGPPSDLKKVASDFGRSVQSGGVLASMAAQITKPKALKRLPKVPVVL